MTAMGERLRERTYDRRRLKVLSLLMLCFPGLTHAGALAPLRVDPALLGGRPAAQIRGVAPDAPVSVKPELSDGETAVRALSIRGLRTVEVVAEGEAEIERGDFRLSADRLTYNELTDEVTAEGNVRMRRGEDTLTSERGTLIVHERSGQFESPTYSFVTPSRSDEQAGKPIVGRGEARSITLEGENHFRMEGATWTTCKPETSDWYIQADEIELDFDRDVGVAKGTSLIFKGVPMLYWPSMSFPLAEQRQSGFLVPSIAASNKTGFDLAVPYYWNIAPNYDATIVPRLMSRRGLQLGAEYRYLTPTYQGQTRVEWLARDRETGEARGLGSIQHQHALTDRLHASVNLNAVTDDQYFEDLSSTLSVASRRNLLKEGRLDYYGGWWNASVLAQGYQTLSGDEPYRRLPQVVLSAFRDDLAGGMEFTLESEYVSFQHPDNDQIDGRRMNLYPQLALPFVRPGWYVTPKVGMHYTRYDLDTPVTAGGATGITRSLPIVSVDSGMVFERDSRMFGRAFQQTLEPRLYYVRIPYEDQSEIPVFDTARFDFGFPQIFTENRYVGIDRIGDANQVTAALTSRFIEAQTGIERMRVTVGQRYHLDDRRVALPDESLSNFGRTDILASFSGRISRSVSLDAATQYNPENQNTQRTNFRIRFQPAQKKVLNIGYRFSRDVLRDIDISAQWPLGGRWYGVGRLTRSLEDSRVTEALAGVEYVSRCGCWALRTAVHRFAINPDDVTNAFFFQLQLTGLGGIGPSPENLIRRSVPGYGVINDSLSDPWFGR